MSRHRAGADLDITPEASAVAGQIHLKVGEKVCFALSYEKGEIGVISPLPAFVDDRLRATISWWKRWADACTYAGPYQEAVRRSGVTLKLMTFALSGAVVAAPTTSLPEAVGFDSNWDYRYCWLRDAALTMKTFASLGFQGETRSFLQWLLHATSLTWPELQVMYDVYGHTNLREQQLDHLSGYRDSRPVRIGNGAHSQKQLDVYGGVICAALAYVRGGGQLQAGEGKLLAGFGRTVCKEWREPDHGIWEIRGPKRHYTFSKVMCWAALNALIKLREHGQVHIKADSFRNARNAIAEAIEAHGFNSRLDSYVGEFGGDRVDASLLLMGCLGYKNPDHPRMRATFDLIQTRLGSKGLLYRYEKGSDALSAPEGAFGMFCFWAVDNLARRGDIDAGARLFEHISNDLGLFAEQIDVESGAALGNFPQAFTHVGLINAATALAAAANGS